MTLRKFATLVALSLLATFPTGAHDLQYTVSGSQAVVIRMFYVDNAPFTFEGYEIYREGEKLPYQVGRTDSQGHIAFLPDRAATWRIKTTTEDGHGLAFKISTDAAATLSGAEKPFYERYARIAIGVAVILGLFGFLNLYVKRKKTY
jgi:nickel transport protein